MNGSGQLTSSQIPTSLIGGMIYQGTWNANTNSPSLADGTGTKGWYYIVATTGTTSLVGSSGQTVSQWNVGDMVVYDGANWDKIDAIGSEVTSVAGRTGAVVLAAADVSGLATSATTDTTNASNISTGTLPAGRLPAFSGDISTTAGASVTTLATVNSNVGTYGSATQASSVTVNAKGLVTAASAITITPAFSSITGSLAASQLPAFTGDISTTAGTSATTLATVNSNVGTFGTATAVGSFTVNAKGLVTAASAITITPAFSSLTGSLAASQLPAFTGDVTSPAGSNVNTLATVNSNVGTFQGITVNGKGLVTAASNIAGAASGLATLTGTSVLTTSQVPAFTGDATSSAGTTALTLATVNANTGSWGSATSSPVFTVNAKGLITASSNVTITPAFASLTGSLAASQLPAFTGDVTSPAGSNVNTLATVNLNVGSFGSATQGADITVNAKGLVTAVTAVTITPAFTSLTGSLASTQLPAFSGDVAVAAGTSVTTLATVNSNVGTYQGLTVNAKGLVTAAVNVEGVASGIATLTAGSLLTTSQVPAFTGDATSTAGTTVLTLATSGVTAGTYNNSATSVTPITVNAKGLVTGTGTAVTITPAFSSLTGSIVAAQLCAFTGDISTSAGTSVTTLATVNSNVGTYQGLTVNAKGLVTAASNIAGAANGLATLDATGHLTSAQIPTSLLGGMIYQGTWNANTNVPALADGTGTKGWYYIVATAGATSLVGSSGATVTQWNVGDMVTYDGANWDKIDAISSEVTSVVGRTGAVTIGFTDLTGSLASTQLPAFSGDVSSPAGSSVTTLATVNSNAGTFQGITVNAKGLVTAAASVAGTPSGLATLNASSVLVTSEVPGFAGGDVTSSAGSLVLTLGTVNSNVGSFGSSTQASVVTVNAKGLVTAASNVTITPAFSSLTGSLASTQLPAFTGDVSSPAGSSVTTLATVNSNVGTYQGLTVNAKGLVTAASNIAGAASGLATLTAGSLLTTSQVPAFTGDATSTAGTTVLTLATSGVTAGTYNGVTVNAKGLVTSGTTGTEIFTNGAITSITLTTSTTTAGQTLDSFSTSLYRTVEYLVSVTSGTSYQATKILILQDGTTANIVEMEDINTAGVLATWDASITGGVLSFITTPTNAVTVYKAIRTGVNV